MTEDILPMATVMVAMTMGGVAEAVVVVAIMAETEATTSEGGEEVDLPLVNIMTMLITVEGVERAVADTAMSTSLIEGEKEEVEEEGIISTTTIDLRDSSHREAS